ncbi:YesL family protein [Ornithinibacillus halotolerans]|uniref:DUF624 domain-containing protein n=1 Tax=Ornithinibacillus halotolerans TaxID=1274357 RepID=A0A916RV96_9BACI|nr:YesL family protein [Ornithinibacillus halotolerans]GGA71505.1 hypothetical protein GCM10008025_14260 [Ornithinibacillus halotolerans]
MGRLTGLMGGLHGIANWVMRISVINIIWFIINLPMIFIIVSALQHEEISGKVLYSIPAILFIPFLLFPSTIAMFVTARDWVMKREQVSLIKAYLSYMKDNYKQSFLSGILWAVIWFVWLVDILYVQKSSQLFTIIFLILGITLFVMNVNYFSVQAHYHMKLKERFKNTFFVTIGSPLLFFGVLVVNLLLVMITMEIWFLFPFFSGTISACLSFLTFYQFTRKVENKRVGESV